jgi:hypothetical protein
LYTDGGAHDFVSCVGAIVGGTVEQQDEADVSGEQQAPHGDGTFREGSKDKQKPQCAEIRRDVEVRKTA